MAILATALFALLLAMASCTVTPVHTTAAVPSYDGGVQNSGLLGYHTNGAVVYRVLTPHSHDRYNGLIDVYGDRFIPHLKHDDGVVPFGTNYLIDPQHWVYALQMNRWRTERK